MAAANDVAPLLLVQMGGTIDKDYPRLTRGYAFEIGEPASARLLARLVPSGLAAEHVSVCAKDSLEVTAEDREALAALLRARPGARCVVTHGTDTLVETARAAHAAAVESGAVAVLTGAMRPERFQDSDAALNVGAALAAAQLCAPGAYVAMNGRVWASGEVGRDAETGRFVSLVGGGGGGGGGSGGSGGGGSVGSGGSGGGAPHGSGRVD